MLAVYPETARKGLRAWPTWVLQPPAWLSAEGASGLADVGAAAAGLATERAGVPVAASVFCWIARRTSPGREILDKSILVLISSSARTAREVFEDAAASSA